MTHRGSSIASPSTPHLLKRNGGHCFVVRRTLLLRYVRRFFCCCPSSSFYFLSWSLEVSLKIVQNLHGHYVTIQTTQKKSFVWYNFFCYTIWQKNKNKIWIFFLTFFNFIVVFFLSKSSGGHAIYRQNARLLEMWGFTPAYMCGWTLCTDDFVRSKISWMLTR